MWHKCARIEGQKYALLLKRKPNMHFGGLAINVIYQWQIPHQLPLSSCPLGGRWEPIFPGTLGKTPGEPNWSDRSVLRDLRKKGPLGSGSAFVLMPQTLLELLELGVHPRGAERSVCLSPWAAHPFPALQSSSLCRQFQITVQALIVPLAYSILSKSI